MRNDDITTMKSIENDIKNGTIKNIYLLIGVEPYLIYQYRDKLVNALISADDEINFKKYVGENVDVEEAIGFSDTMPFFAKYRVLLFEDTGLLKKSNDKLAGYLLSVPESTVIIFTECFAGDRSEEKNYEKHLLDKRLKLYKSIRDRGRIVEFKRTSPEILYRWILGKFKNAGLMVENGTVEKLFEYVGDDMMTLANETEKLICYKLGEEAVGVADVAAISSKNISGDIFEMVSAIASKNKKKALDLYYDLITLKEAPLKILALIAREYRMLLAVKKMRDERKDDRQIAAATGIHPYYVGKYKSVATRLSEDYIREALEDCAEIDKDFKSGLINDVIGVEMIIIKYSA